jgi:heme oxygenase (biliverdin-IX-beta and delta-forming)
MELPPRRTALKEATAEAHAALDAMVGHFQTLDDYKLYLTGIASFRLPVEAWLSQTRLPADLDGYAPHMVQPELEADLADLQAPEPKNQQAFRPPEGEGVVGLLYVLEGSSLGARLLAKRAEALGLSANFDIFFLRRGTFPVGVRCRSVWRTCVDTTTEPLRGGPTPLSTMPVVPSKVP